MISPPTSKIPFESDALHRFSDVALNGRTGDPTGSRRYRELTEEPTDKWRTTLVNPVRKEWCRRYLRFLGPERLRVMGYDHDLLQRELDAQPLTTECLRQDVGEMIKDLVKEPIRVRTRYRWVGGPNVIRELLAA